jgi:elongation factor Ts
LFQEEHPVEISAERIKELREKSGAGVMDCKRALVDAEGDLERAMALLRERGLAQVAKRAGRQASEGVVESYVHGGGRIGVLVEVNCETDFVARTPDFRTLAHDIAMQIAATNPPSIRAEEGDVPDPDSRETNLDKIPLLQQPFIKDASRTIADLVRDVAAKTNENVVIRRFARFELGS